MEVVGSYYQNCVVVRWINDKIPFTLPGDSGCVYYIEDDGYFRPIALHRASLEIGSGDDQRRVSVGSLLYSIFNKHQSQYLEAFNKEILISFAYPDLENRINTKSCLTGHTRFIEQNDPACSAWQMIDEADFQPLVPPEAPQPAVFLFLTLFAVLVSMIAGLGFSV